MRTGAIHFSAGSRGRVALALILALFLPLLLGIIPQPALSAEAQLDWDIAASLCEPQGEGQGSRDQHAGHEQCCILCPAGASAAVTLKEFPPTVFGPEATSSWAMNPVKPLFHARRPELMDIIPRGPPLL